MAIETKLIPGFEGYGPVDKNSNFPQPIPGITFYGYFPVKDMFSIVYRSTDQVENIDATFSFLIDKTDTIALEYLLKRDAVARSWRSETCYCKTVFMTCMSGSNPVISFPYRGFSLRFYNGEDYDELLEKATKFLDYVELDEQQKEFREDLHQQLKELLEKEK